MSTDLSIRPVSRLDYDQWLSLWQGYNAFYGRSGPTALAAEITQITWARFFDAYEPIYALVAEISGQLVGLAHYLFHRSTTTITPACYLQDLFTVETARGKGVGKALIQGVYEQAKSAGSTRIYWHTHETNKTARRLYDQVAENSGFIVYRNHERTSPMTNIQLATDPTHIKRCAPVLRELRTFLTEDQIMDRVQQQMTDGYRLAYIEAADIVASVAGYRILRNLTYGKFVYVDDLVTRADHKRAGYAGQLLEWLCEHARDQGCSFFILDSGVQRFEAHRFYLAHRMDITAHHFARKL